MHRAYLETFLENQIRSVASGSQEDIFYGFSERLPPSIRLATLEERLEWLKDEESLEWTSCEPEDVHFTDDG